MDPNAPRSLPRLVHRHWLGIRVAVVLSASLSAAAEAPTRRDARGDPLPEGAIDRIGSTRFRHSDTVWCLAFSPDGKTLASGGCDEVVRFWDVKTGRQVGVSSRYCSGIGALAYSPDGATLAVSDWNSSKAGVSLLNPATANERRFLGFPHYPSGHSGGAVAFAPDGKILAAVNPVGEICLFEFASGEQIAVLGKHDHSNVPVLVFSPDGRMLASSSQDATIRLWDVVRRKALFVLRSEDTSVFPLVFSRDGKWLISGGGTQKTPDDWDSPWGNPAIRVWDAATGKQHRVFKDTEVCGRVSSLALSPDGRTLAVSCEDKFRLWDWDAGKVLRTLRGTRNRYWPVGKVCFSPDGKTLAGRIGYAIGLWDAASGRLLNLDDADPASGISSVAMTGDGRLLAGGDHDGWVSLWDFRSRRLIRRFRGHETAVRQIDFSPDDRTLASISEHDRLRAWDVAGARQLYQFPLEEPMNSCPRNLAFTPDGKLLAYSYFSALQQGGPRGIRLLDAASGAERQNLTIGDAVLDWFVGIGFSPDGRHLVGTTSNGATYNWRRESDRFTHMVSLGRESPGCDVAYTDRGFLSVDWPSGKALSFRGYETGRPLRDLSRFPQVSSVVVFSRDGRYLASGPPNIRGGDPKKPRDTTLRLVEMTAGQEVLRWQLPPHTACHALTFAPDGRTLIAAMTDTTILLWDLFPVDKRSAMNLPALWADLADNDAKKAYRSMCRLIAAPAEALALLRSHLKPVESVDQRRIDRWISDLDADEFAVRDKATKELQQLGELVEPKLRKALASRPTLEMRRRLQGLLDDLFSLRPSPEIIRQLRALEVLERLGTPESLRLLEALANGAEGARQTREAKAAVQRLRRKK